MPIYEYRCLACDHEFEAIQKMSDDPLKDCPSCSKPELKKKVSASAFRLKGGGWYETDFKTDGKKNLAGDGPQDTGTSTGSAGKSESSSSSSDTGASSGGTSSGSKESSGSKSE